MTFVGCVLGAIVSSLEDKGIIIVGGIVVMMMLLGFNLFLTLKQKEL
jgi:hypothetical protein